jgi:uncharacterized membrane protein YgcG
VRYIKRPVSGDAYKIGNMKQIILTILFLLIVSTSSGSVSFAQTKNDKTPSNANYSIKDGKPLLPAPKGFVNDFAEILDQKTKDELEQTLAGFKAEAKIDFVIVIIKTTGNKTSFDYSLSVANGWAVGATNPDKAGILMLIAVDDRRWHIQITRVLEKFLSDTEVGELGALMVPLFKEKKYGEGITKCVDKFIEVLKEKRDKK